MSTGIDLFFATARERESIRRKRESGAPGPWTQDPIFAEWRFCNVHREHDKTTVWFRENVRQHLDGYRAVEATVAFRWFNRIETGERLRDLLLSGWDRDEAYRRLCNVRPIITGSYIIRGPNGFTKLEAILKCIDWAIPVLKKMEWPRRSLENVWLDLRAIPYLGRFMAYEVVSDLRWTPVLSSADDINTWANAGPGCARGLGWVMKGNHAEWSYGSPKHQAVMLENMRELLEMSRALDYWPYPDTPWEMREVEHWLCETWKYVRCRDEGQGPRQRFRGGE